ncbi:MAG: hypothetical protein FJW40_08945 [Acidobacteria bacterium]|nr:hypothetical protein [Acidobacteriota bacterium]
MASFDHVFHSSNDPVLKFGFTIGQLDKALGLDGPEHPLNTKGNTRLADCSPIVQSHGGYRSAPEYFDYWKGEVEGPEAAKFTVIEKAR